MGRRAAVKESEWAEIGKRVLAGESMRALAKEYGVSDTAIRKKFSVRTKEIKSVANQLVAAEISLQNLDYSSQRLARTMADRLLSISDDMASAAMHAASSVNVLSGIANRMTHKLNKDGPQDDADIEAIKHLAYVTRTSNDAAVIPLALLKSVKELHEQEASEQMNWTINAVAPSANAG